MRQKHNKIESLPILGKLTKKLPSLSTRPGKTCFRSSWWLSACLKCSHRLVSGFRICKSISLLVLINTNIMKKIQIYQYWWGNNLEFDIWRFFFNFYHLFTVQAHTQHNKFYSSALPPSPPPPAPLPQSTILHKTEVKKLILRKAMKHHRTLLNLKGTHVSKVFGWSLYPISQQKTRRVQNPTRFK